MRSLSRLVRLASRSEVKDDWTGALDRARRLVDAADRVHRTARRSLKSLHIAADGRVIYARARDAADLASLTTLLGDEFSRALNGSGLVVTIVTRTAPPPGGALRVRDFARSVHRAAAQMRAASAALAVGGFVAGATTLAAAQTESALSPLASLTTEGDWACGIVASERLWTVGVVLRPDDRDVEVIDGGDGAGAASVLDFIRNADEGALRADPLALSGPRGERIVAIVRYEDSGDRFDLTIASCPAPVAAPGVSFVAEPFSWAYEEFGADYINRTEQDGLVAAGVRQIPIGSNAALNLQFALGDIDNDPAIGGQAAVQTFRSLGGNAEAAIGAFASAVQSTAPDRDELAIQRAGAGVSVIGDETQIVVLGGYAQSSGYLDTEGAFVRAEAGWFPVERMSLDVFVEEDPVTGAGAGVGAAVRPFSGVYAGLMIDADAAWHEDGEESFRLGVRWTFGQEQTSERDRRRRRGMAPYMPQEFERLPDTNNDTQSYCGDADPSCTASTSAPFHE